MVQKKNSLAETLSKPENLVSLGVIALLIFVTLLYKPSATNTNTNTNAPAPTANGQEAPEDVNVYPQVTISDKDRIWGPKDAQVSIVEFTDFECPYCSRLKDYPEKIVDEFKGKVNWVFKNLPLSFHEPYASREANFLECAANVNGMDAYITLHKDIYSGDGEYTEEQLLEMAKNHNYDDKKIKQCMDEKKFAQKIAEDTSLAEQVGANGTPTLIIMDHKNKKALVIPGAVAYENLKNQVQQFLK